MTKQNKGFCTLTKIIAAVFMLTLLASCKPSEQDVKTAENTVTSMMTEISSGNGISSPDKYLDSELTASEDIDALNLRKMFDEYDLVNNELSMFKDICGEEKTQQYADNIFNKTVEKFTYSIDSSEIDGNNIIVSATLNVPNFSDISMFDDYSEDEVLNNVFGIQSADELVNKFMEKQNITMEQFAEKYSNMTQDELLKDFYNVFSTEIDTYLNSMIDNAFSKMETSAESMKFTLEKQDGSWKIINVV